jgi:hypothetical protein
VQYRRPTRLLVQDIVYWTRLATISFVMRPTRTGGFEAVRGLVGKKRR